MGRDLGDVSEYCTCGDVFTKTRTILFVTCYFLFLVFFFFSKLVSVISEVAIVLDIMEGQWRGRAQKLPKCHKG